MNLVAALAALNVVHAVLVLLLLPHRAQVHFDGSEARHSRALGSAAHVSLRGRHRSPRQTDRQTNRPTDGQETSRRTDGQETSRRTDGQETDRRTDRRTDEQTDRRTDGQADRQTGRLTDRQADAKSRCWLTRASPTHTKRNGKKAARHRRVSGAFSLSNRTESAKTGSVLFGSFHVLILRQHNNKKTTTKNNNKKTNQPQTKNKKKERKKHRPRESESARDFCSQTRRQEGDSRERERG